MASAEYQRINKKSSLTDADLSESDIILGTHLPDDDDNYDIKFYLRQCRTTPVATCATDADQTVKTATVSNAADFVLATGRIILVKFSQGNTATSFTLNVNSTGATDVKYQGSTTIPYQAASDEAYLMIYDGTNWCLLSDAVKIDTEATADSTNLLTSGVIYNIKTAIETRLSNLEDGTTPAAKATQADSATSADSATNATNATYAETLGDTDFGYTASDLQTALSGKQDTLTFDSTPTADSSNPVTSDGVQKAIAASQSAAGLVSYTVVTAGDAAGSATTYEFTATLTGVTQLTDGLTVKLLITSELQSSTAITEVDLNINSLGAKAIKAMKNNTLVNLASKALTAGADYTSDYPNRVCDAYTTLELVYSSTADAWVVMGNPNVMTYSSDTSGYTIKADGFISQSFVVTSTSSSQVFNTEVPYLIALEKVVSVNERQSYNAAPSSTTSNISYNSAWYYCGSINRVTETSLYITCIDAKITAYVQVTGY